MQHNPIHKDFETKVLLFLSGEMSREEKKFWEDAISTDAELQKIKDETIATFNFLEELPEVIPSGKTLDSVLGKTTNKTGFVDFTDNFKALFLVNRLTPMFKLVILLIFFTAGLSLIFFNQSHKTRLSEEKYLDWEGTDLNEQIEELDNKIMLVKNLESSFASPDWNEKIMEIDERLKFSNENGIIYINDNIINSLME